MKYLVRASATIPTRQHRFLKSGRQPILKIAKPNRVIKKYIIPLGFVLKRAYGQQNMILKRVLFVIMIKIFKDVDDTKG